MYYKNHTVGIKQLQKQNKVDKLIKKKKKNQRCRISLMKNVQTQKSLIKKQKKSQSKSQSHQKSRSTSKPLKKQKDKNIFQEKPAIKVSSTIKYKCENCSPNAINKKHLKKQKKKTEQENNFLSKQKKTLQIKTEYSQRRQSYFDQQQLKKIQGKNFNTKKFNFNQQEFNIPKSNFNFYKNLDLSSTYRQESCIQRLYFKQSATFRDYINKKTKDNESMEQNYSFNNQTERCKSTNRQNQNEKAFKDSSEETLKKQNKNLKIIRNESNSKQIINLQEILKAQQQKWEKILNQLKILKQKDFQAKKINQKIEQINQNCTNFFQQNKKIDLNDKNVEIKNNLQFPIQSEKNQKQLKKIQKLNDLQISFVKNIQQEFNYNFQNQQKQVVITTQIKKTQIISSEQIKSLSKIDLNKDFFESEKIENNLFSEAIVNEQWEDSDIFHVEMEKEHLKDQIFCQQQELENDLTENSMIITDQIALKQKNIIIIQNNESNLLKQKTQITNRYNNQYFEGLVQQFLNYLQQYHKKQIIQEISKSYELKPSLVLKLVRGQTLNESMISGHEDGPTSQIINQQMIQKFELLAQRKIITKETNIFNQTIFQFINEALDSLRPFGSVGRPLFSQQYRAPIHCFQQLKTKVFCYKQQDFLWTVNYEDQVFEEIYSCSCDILSLIIEEEIIFIIKDIQHTQSYFK